MAKSKAQVAWLVLMNELKIPTHVHRPFWQALSQRYREKSRYYHRLKHLGQFLDHLEALKKTLPGCSISPALKLAVFYHDIVYDARRNDNELVSWQMAEEFLKAADLIERYGAQVHCLILATASHKKALLEPDCGLSQAELDLFLDCDLLILASRPRAYKLYCRQIRKEYAHYEPAVFNAGRKAFLESFSQAERIYRSEAVHHLYHDATRQNLLSELKELAP